MEQPINKTEQEKIIVKILKNYFSKFNAKYFHEWRNSYFRVFNKIYLSELFVQINPSGLPDMYHSLTIYSVDNILLEIGVPNMVLDTYLSKKHFLSTVLNKGATLSSDMELKPIKTEFDCIKYCENIIQYLEKDGVEFEEKYSYLPNILEEMNSNQNGGIYWSFGVLKGTSEPFMVGLIISKLCNDPDYENKFNYVMGLYSASENKLTAYLPYLEKLKERLKIVEPIYNV